MIVEKENDTTSWYLDNNLKIRLQDLDDEKIGVWASIQKINPYITMIANDFIDWCEREACINIYGCSNWNNHKGFLIDSKDKAIFIQEIKRFIDEFDIHASENEDKYADAEWYS